MPFRKRLIIHLTLMLLITIGGWLMVLNVARTPLKNPNPTAVTSSVKTDAYLAIAREFAPRIVHAAHPTDGRQDIPTAIDFDGDFNGANNWENFPAVELLPTLYYTVLETETHWIIAYHLFHPRDWTTFDLGIHMTHEGDGENLQLVIRKESRTVECVYAQAHYIGEWAVHESLIDPSEIGFDGLQVLVQDVDQRVLLFVESGGHGISTQPPDSMDLSSLATATEPLQSLDGCIIFNPANPDEFVTEPDLSEGFLQPVPYRLISTVETLWPGVQDGSLVGDGKAFKQTFTYSDGKVTIELPKYHHGDRFSGPLGPDRGISPFAMGMTFSHDELGGLYFDPANWYPVITSNRFLDPWSLNYINYPFADTFPSNDD